MFRLRALLSAWWQHRASFFISVGITFAALTIYFFTFLGDRSTPLFDFLKRFEYSTLDTRFRYRPVRCTPPDSRIVIVTVDQRSQEVFGKWPFSRKYFGQMPDALHELFGHRLDLQQEGSRDEAAARFEQSDEARKLYRQRQWADAQRSFQAILDRWPNDGPSLVYCKRCAEYLNDEPVADWDGVFTMTPK